MKFKTVWTVDAQDFSKGQGGFQGGYFRVRGVTDRDFESLEAALAALDRQKRYRRIGAMAGFDAVYQYEDGRAKFLCVTTSQRKEEG